MKLKFILSFISLLALKNCLLAQKTFIPELDIEKDSRDNSGWVWMQATKGFNLFYKEETGHIKLLNAEGDTIFAGLYFVSEFVNEKNEHVKYIADHFNREIDMISDDVANFQYNTKSDTIENKIQLKIDKEGNIDISVDATIKQNLKLVRHALCISYALPLKAVEKKNKTIDTTGFKDEYWLDKEGFILSNNKTYIHVYRPGNVTSTQLDTKNHFAIFNMDYSLDHPMLNFPLLSKGSGKYKDCSPNEYKSGDEMHSTINFYVTAQKQIVPKLLLAPNGYMASISWVDLAAYTDIRTNKAVYFGSEKIDNMKNATGGFFKYSIPVTKSIFYSNPDRVDNSELNMGMKGPELSFKESEPFKQFIRHLYENGMEICLNTPDHNTADRKLVEEALESTRREFAPITWVDHGYDNSNTSNRENLICDGYESSSKWYVADLWKLYGIKYFWNPYDDVVGNYSVSNADDATPHPAYWKNSKTEDVIHWRAANINVSKDGTSMQNFFSEENLNKIVSGHENIIVCSNAARIDTSGNFYSFEKGAIVASEKFNNSLKKLADYRRGSKIWIPTVRQSLDYRLRLEKISYRFSQEGIRITNNGASKISGITFSANAGSVNITGKKIESKKSNNELIFWFDIEAGESVQLILK